jgi:hypothetical protein
LTPVLIFFMRVSSGGLAAGHDVATAAGFDTGLDADVLLHGVLLVGSCD